MCSVQCAVGREPQRISFTAVRTVFRSDGEALAYFSVVYSGACFLHICSIIGSVLDIIGSVSVDSTESGPRQLDCT